MKRFLNAFLFWLALVLAVIFVPFGLIYGAIRNRIILRGPRSRQLLSDKNRMLAIVIDKLGNTAGAELWNDLFIKPHTIHYPFGHHDDTLSEVFGRNKKGSTLSPLGKCIAAILNKLDPNHVERAIGHDQDGFL